MMRPDDEFYLWMAVKIIGLGIVVSTLHNVLGLIAGQSHFWDF